MDEEIRNKYTEHADRVSERTIKLSNNTEKFVLNGLNTIEKAITLLHKNFSRIDSKEDKENKVHKK